MRVNDRNWIPGRILGIFGESLHSGGLIHESANHLCLPHKLSLRILPEAAQEKHISFILWAALWHCTALVSTSLEKGRAAGHPRAAGDRKLRPWNPDSGLGVMTHQMCHSHKPREHEIVTIPRDSCVYFKAHSSPLNEEMKTFISNCR